MIYYNVKFSIFRNNFFITGPLGSIKITITKDLITNIQIESILDDAFLSKQDVIELNEFDFKIWLVSLNLSDSELNLFKKRFQKCISFVCFGNFAYLRLVGIGYKVEQLGNQLNLNLGYSHSITLNIPNNIQTFIPKGFKDQKLTLFGLDLESVILFRSQIREICKPEVYKGKGIRFENEVIVLKENKKNN